MKNKIGKLIIFLMSVVLIFTFSGCGFISCDGNVDTVTLPNLAMDDENASRSASPVSYHDVGWSEVNLTAVESKMTAAEKYMGKSIDEIVSTMTSLAEYINKIGYYADYAFIEYCKNIMSKYADKQLEYNNAFDKYRGRYNVLRYVIATSRSYKRYFTDEERNKYRQFVSIGASGDSESVLDIASRINEIKVEYAYLDENSSTYADDVYDLYMESVKLNNRLAQNYGYDNYVDYAYSEIYGYYFTADEAKDFFAALKGSKLKEGYNALTLKADDTLAAMTEEDYSSFFTYKMNDDFSKLSKVIEEHAARVGEPMQKAFEHMVDYNYFYIAGAYDYFAYNGSYVQYLYGANSPYMFIKLNGSAYDITTIIHELGHYTYDYANNGVYATFDFSETHSQTNELLFIEEYDKLFNERVADYLKLQVQLGVVESAMITGATIAEFEQEVYTNPSKYRSADDLSELYADIYAQYTGEDGDNFWLSVPHIITSPMYYISYAVSAISAFNIYIEYVSDSEKGLSEYNSLFGEDTIGKKYDEILENIGVELPTESATIEKVCNYFIGTTV